MDVLVLDEKDEGHKKEKQQLLSIAMIGCGNISHYHLKAICALRPQRVRIGALVDPQKDAAITLANVIQEKLGYRPPIFNSLDQALQADSDHHLFSACDVMVPSWTTLENGDLHEIIATKVLLSGRHLLLEKPIAVSSEAAKRLIAVHANVNRKRNIPKNKNTYHTEDPPKALQCPSKIVFAVAENAQFWPEVVEAKNLMQGGVIGEVLCARAKFWESAMGEWAVDYLPGSWRCDATKLPAASFVFDGMTHWIRPLRMWFGEVSTVAGIMGTTIAHMAGPSMSQHIVKFNDTGKAAIVESVLAPTAISDQPFFTIQGTKGEIVIHGFDGGLNLYTVAADGKTVLEKEVCHEGWNASYALEYENFVAACLDGTPLAAEASSALADLKVIEAMVAAHKTKAWVNTISKYEKSDIQSPPSKL